MAEYNQTAESISAISLDHFPGAESYHDIYTTFIRHLYKLLGWWLGDLPSYGMVIRIIFDPLHVSSEENKVDPAFICEKIHLVNRLHGMGSSGLRAPWMEATSFDPKSIRGVPGNEGVTIETERLSLDVSVPGIKTEKLWVASWSSVRHLENSKAEAGTDVAKMTWQGSEGGLKLSSVRDLRDPSILGRQGEPSIISRARALAERMVFGHTTSRNGVVVSDDEDESGDQVMMDEEDDTLPDVGPGVFGHGLTISQIVAASAVDTFANGDFDHIPHQLRTIQQRSGQQVHTVFLSSGAILTTPAREKGEKEGEVSNRLSVRCEKYRPYENSRNNKGRAFGLNMSDFMPLPPIDFPPPAVLPLVRDIDSDFVNSSTPPANNSSTAYERFIDDGEDFKLNVLRMEPCPPYRPWPHLSQPQPTGLRFVAIQSPSSGPEDYAPARRDEDGQLEYYHDANVWPRLDPANPAFDWDSLQGLYGMTYGPWGLELIFIRSRILTVHDFEPYGVAVPTDEQIARPNGPHGTGHEIKAGSRILKETLHWRPEPYIDVRDLQMPLEEVAFIKPGCRVIEGVKCSGDANVPRGTVSFRAFSRGQDQDDCIAFTPPGLYWANQPPWDGRGVNRTYSQQSKELQHPGRILDCATGRLAIEGFVNAGTWKRCSVKITSSNEIHVYWEALRKVAVAKRLTCC